MELRKKNHNKICSTINDGHLLVPTVPMLTNNVRRNALNRFGTEVYTACLTHQRPDVWYEELFRCVLLDVLELKVREFLQTKTESSR